MEQEFDNLVKKINLKQGNNIKIYLGNVNNYFFNIILNKNCLNIISLINSYFQKNYKVSKFYELKDYYNTIQSNKSNNSLIIKNDNVKYHIIKENFIITFNNTEVKNKKYISCDKNYPEENKWIKFEWNIFSDNKDEKTSIIILSYNGIYNLYIDIDVKENIEIKKEKLKKIKSILIFFDKILSKIDLNTYGI